MSWTPSAALPNSPDRVSPPPTISTTSPSWTRSTYRTSNARSSNTPWSRTPRASPSSKSTFDSWTSCNKINGRSPSWSMSSTPPPLPASPRTWPTKRSAGRTMPGDYSATPIRPSRKSPSSSSSSGSAANDSRLSLHRQGLNRRRPRFMPSLPRLLRLPTSRLLASTARIVGTIWLPDLSAKQTKRPSRINWRVSWQSFNGRKTSSSSTRNGLLPSCLPRLAQPCRRLLRQTLWPDSTQPSSKWCYWRKALRRSKTSSTQGASQVSCAIGPVRRSCRSLSLNSSAAHFPIITPPAVSRIADEWKSH